MTRRRSFSTPAVVWRDGVQLADSIVWCDPRVARDLSFVSHAHFAPKGQLRRIIASPLTRVLLDGAGRLPGAEVLPSPFGRPFHMGALRLELFPSGHVPGAASLLLVDGEGRRIVYASDVNPRRGLAEPMEVRGADVLVLEAPLASLDVTLPSREGELLRLVALAEAAVAAGQGAVILGPSLGALQEAQRALGEAGLPLKLHPQVAAWSDLLTDGGVALPRPTTKRGPAVVLWPAGQHAAPALARYGAARRIAIGLLACDPVAAAAARADERVLLVDHADRPSLVEYVLDTGAHEVHLVAGWSEALAATFAAEGVAAHPLLPPSQMALL